MQEAGTEAVLYRGPCPMSFQFRYKGTFYAFDNKFSEGNLWYNNKYYTGVFLNLDANRDELYIVRKNNSTIGTVLKKNLVEKFTFDNNKEFTNITEESPVRNLPVGYYQVIYGGKDRLLKKIKKIYQEKPDQIDENGIYRYFNPSYSYFLVKDNTAYPVSKQKSFGNIYKEKKNGIKKFIKTNNLKDIKQEETDNCFRKIMQFIEENQ